MREPVRIEVEDAGAFLRVAWDDGEVDLLPASTLRAACPCAGCKEPSGIRDTVRALTRDARIVGAHLVGGYAIGLQFSPDGHATGIFPYALLDSVGREAERSG